MKLFKKTLYLLLPIAFAFQSMGFSQAAFSRKDISVGDKYPHCVEIADLNNDSYPDIISAVWNDQQFVIFYNQGNGNYSRKVLDSGFPGARYIIAVDIDQDQDLDLVSVSRDNDQITLWKNNGSNHFYKKTIDDDYDGASAVRTADMNNDSYMDIIVAGWNNKRISVFYQNDIGNFTESIVSQDELDWISFVDVGDIDGDGDQDILTASYKGHKIVWYENIDGNFTGHEIVTGFQGAHTAVLKDLDSDGDLDVMGAAIDGGLFSYWLNDGQAGFTRRDFDDDESGNIFLDAADLDNDGDLDIMGITEISNRIVWYENMGGFRLTKHALTTNYQRGSCIKAGDMDGDGDVDIVSCGGDPGYISLWENTMIEAPENIMDVDGNIYKTIEIGDQTWMAENMRARHYPDGLEITDGLYDYDGDPEKIGLYGLLYNWDAAMGRNKVSGGQGICPDGWHVPSDGEWTKLGVALGGNNVAGGKMKTSGTDLWKEPNTGADNTSGFTGLPAGEWDNGSYTFEHEALVMWSSTEDGSNKARYRYLHYDNAALNPISWYKTLGYSVRCIKDKTNAARFKKAETDIKLYPNPANEKLFIERFNEYCEADLKVYNDIGQCIYSRNISGNTHSIKTTDFPSGYYVLTITSPKESTSKSFMVQ